jgi:hypothetical protein
VTVIKVIGAIDQPASTLGADRRDDLLGILIKNFGFGGSNQSEQGAAKPLGIGPAIVIVIAAVFVDVCAVKSPGVAPTPINNNSSPLPSATSASALSINSRKPDWRATALSKIAAAPRRRRCRQHLGAADPGK